MKYRVHVRIKDGVLDPEMETLHRLLKRSGAQGIKQLQHTQMYEIKFSDEAVDAENTVKRLAADVLANPEIHDWTIESL